MGKLTINGDFPSFFPKISRPFLGNIHPMGPQGLGCEGFPWPQGQGGSNMGRKKRGIITLEFITI